MRIMVILRTNFITITGSQQPSIKLSDWPSNVSVLPPHLELQKSLNIPAYFLGRSPVDRDPEDFSELNSDSYSDLLTIACGHYRARLLDNLMDDDRPIFTETVRSKTIYSSCGHISERGHGR